MEIRGKEGAMESIKVEGGQLLDQVKRVIHEGNVRRVRIKQEDRVIVEFPLTVGVVGVALAPVLAAVGAIAALLTDCTIEIERVGEGGAGGEGADSGAPAVAPTASGEAASTGQTPGAAATTPGASWPRTHEPPTAGL